MIRLISALDSKRGIAKNGDMPWHIQADLDYFKANTKSFGAKVIAGRTTFESAFHGQGLEGREVYVLTHRKFDGIPSVHTISDLTHFINDHSAEDFWVAGGASVFQQCIDLGFADELYLTHVQADFNCNQFFPEFDNLYQQSFASPMQHMNGLDFYYARYVKREDIAK